MARAARQQNDEPDEDDVEEPDDDQEDDQEEDEEEEYKPPTADEWKATQDALKKANSEAKRFRTQLRNARKETKGEPKQDQQEAEDKVLAQWKPRLVRSEARAALASAGAKKTALTRLARMIDIDDVEVDDDGEVTGLDDLIEDLRDDLPELFVDDDDEPAPKRRKRLGKTDAGAKGTSSNGAKVLSSSERQARALYGR